MYDLPFDLDEKDLKNINNPFPWKPIILKPPKNGKYLACIEGHEIPTTLLFENGKWKSLIGNKVKNITHWGFLPEIAKVQYAKQK